MRFVFLLLCSVAVAFAAPPVATVDEGEIEGARFAVARPATRWNGKILLLAHGLRDETAPLVADLSPDHLAYRTLLAEGWIVGKTSYRRNGLILADAIADLDNLRAHVVKTYGAPRRVLLEGDSMGGLIVTLIAERPAGDDPLYHGAVAVGASLNLREADSKVGLSLGTRIPLLFLTNRSELDGPKDYVRAQLPREIRPVTPALFRVAREGHVNVNQRERLVALRAVDAWLDEGASALPAPAEGSEFFDATQEPQPGPSQVVVDARRQSFSARVTEVSAIYGNVSINAQAADFATIGVGKNARFQLIVAGQTRAVLFGRGFDSVKRGEWVAFPNAEGFTWLARRLENAAKTAALAVGDEVIVQRFGDAGREQWKP